MRPVHFARYPVRGLVEPLCGDWGSMATHWTEDAAGVTCDACLVALRGHRPGAPSDPALPSGS